MIKEVRLMLEEGLSVGISKKTIKLKFEIKGL